LEEKKREIEDTGHRSNRYNKTVITSSTKTKTTQNAARRRRNFKLIREEAKRTKHKAYIRKLPVAHPFFSKPSTMPDTVIQRLSQNARKSAKKEAFTFLASGPNGGVVDNKFTYNDIETKTTQLALDLLGAGLKKGDL